MYRNNIFLKNVIICLVVCVTVLAVCLVPSLLPSQNSPIAHDAWQNQNSQTQNPQNLNGQTPILHKQLSNGPAVFAAGASKTEMAETLLDAIATVVIVNTGTQTNAGFGSGVAIAEDGYLVTNYHVISRVVTQPTKYSIQLHMMVEGNLVENIGAELLWYSSSLDMAILKSQQNFRTYAQMSDRWINSNNKLKITEEIWTLGTPAELTLWGSYSKGTISSSLPRIATTSVEMQTYIHNYLIQHDAPISSGNSGGPLFDNAGFLVGLNTCGQPSTSSITATNLFFAVPIYPATFVLDKVIEKYDQEQQYTTPVLGVQGYDKDYDIIQASLTFEDDGFFVEEITADSPAFNANIPAGSVIVGIGGENCTDKLDPTYFAIRRSYDLVYALLHYETGDKITAFYKFENQTHSVIVEL